MLFHGWLISLFLGLCFNLAASELLYADCLTEFLKWGKVPPLKLNWILIHLLVWVYTAFRYLNVKIKRLKNKKKRYLTNFINKHANIEQKKNF